MLLINLLRLAAIIFVPIHGSHGGKRLPTSVAHKLRSLCVIFISTEVKLFVPSQLINSGGILCRLSTSAVSFSFCWCHCNIDFKSTRIEFNSTDVRSPVHWDRYDMFVHLSSQTKRLKQIANFS